MSSITVGELINILQQYPEDYEVFMKLHHQYDISATEGKLGWIAQINAVDGDSERGRIDLMN